MWTLGEPLPAPNVWAAAASTSGVAAPARLYVLGGTSDGINGVNTNRIYDPQSNSWTTGALMPTTRGALTVAVVNDTLYALGGTDNFPNPQTGTKAASEQYFPPGYGESSTSSTLSAIYIAVIVGVVVIIAVVAAFISRKHRKKLREIP